MKKYLIYRPNKFTDHIVIFENIDSKYQIIYQNGPYQQCSVLELSAMVYVHLYPHWYSFADNVDKILAKQL